MKAVKENSYGQPKIVPDLPFLPCQLSPDRQTQTVTQSDRQIDTHTDTDKEEDTVTVTDLHQ